MKATPISIILGIILSLGSVSFAQEKGKGRPSGGREGGGPPPHGNPIMDALDANSDGKLQQGEIDMAVVALRKLDKDKDGTISEEELHARGGGGPGGPPGGDRPGMGGGPPTIDRLDKDGDGKLSKSEAPERMKERFDEVDTNSDGFVDKAELEKLVARIREMGGGKGKGGGGKGGSKGKGKGGAEGQGEGVTPKRPPLEE